MLKTAAVMTGFLLGLAEPSLAQAQVFPPGASKQVIRLGDTSLTVFTYRPSCREPGLLVVFHGQKHNADDYRDWARPLADKHCLLVAAPLFAKSEFPRWRYQHGGVAKDGAAQDPGAWTGRLAEELARRIRALEGRQMPYSMIGHSAGGQFLSRFAAFTPSGAQRIVIANPGTHVFPDARVKVPYGFRGAYPSGAMDDQLRRYLGAPVTLFLGEDDTDEEGSINTGAAAEAQGKTRHERGLNAYKAGKELAAARGWPFSWRLVELAGVGHDARRMLASPEASQALKP